MGNLDFRSEKTHPKLDWMGNVLVVLLASSRKEEMPPEHERESFPVTHLRRCSSWWLVGLGWLLAWLAVKDAVKNSVKNAVKNAVKKHNEKRYGQTM